MDDSTKYTEYFKDNKNSKTGILINGEDLKLQRQYFEEMCLLKGLTVLYRTPIKGMKQYDLHGELDTNYNAPIKTYCLLEENITQRTAHKLGWITELTDNMTVIHVPYDLPDIQVGCLFILPSGIDGSIGRVFKVVRMSTTNVYPASIACELGPVMTSNFERSQLHDFSKDDFTLTNEGTEEDWELDRNPRGK